MGTISYANNTLAPINIFRATSGGTVFSADVKAGAFDIFDDSPTADDCVYFGFSSTTGGLAKFIFDISAAIAGTDVVIIWEYYGCDEDTATNGWLPMSPYGIQDDTSDFTVTGSNAFNFGLPWRQVGKTVNSVYARWFRVRLVSFTTVTEGGRITSFSSRRARVNINGYTDLSPCTLEDIYQDLITNYPWLPVTRTRDFEGRTHYDFRPVELYCNSRTLGLDCGFEIGNGYSGLRPHNNLSSFSYLQMGEKVGDEFGKNGGWIIIHGASNSYGIGFGSNMKLYGSYMKGDSGYYLFSGEIIDCIIDGMSFNMSSSGVMINNSFKTSTWLLNGMASTFSKNKVTMPTRWGLVYNASLVVRELDYVTVGYIFSHNNAYAADKTYRFINSVRPLPPVNPADDPDGLYLIYRPVYNATLTFGKVWFYDASAGTYTDYTTECGNTTINDMPLYGDVGDIYYFGTPTTSMLFGTFFAVTSAQSNDYEYKFEFYQSSAWREATIIKDATNNFSQNGNYYPFTPISAAMTSLNVNGYTGNWVRLVITAKGTGSPMVSRILYAKLMASSNWLLTEEYGFSCVVVDEEKNTLENVSVTMTYNGDSVFNELTDSNGSIDEQEIVYRRVYWDPTNESGTADYRRIADVYMDYYDLTISKAGYETYTSKIDMSRKREFIITLKKAISVFNSNTGQPVLRNNYKNSGNGRDIVTII